MSISSDYPEIYLRNAASPDPSEDFEHYESWINAEAFSGSPPPPPLRSERFRALMMSPIPVMMSPNPESSEPSEVDSRPASFSQTRPMTVVMSSPFVASPEPEEMSEEELYDGYDLSIVWGEDHRSAIFELQQFFHSHGYSFKQQVKHNELGVSFELVAPSGEIMILEMEDPLVEVPRVRYCPGSGREVIAKFDHPNTLKIALSVYRSRFDGRLTLEPKIGDLLVATVTSFYLRSTLGQQRLPLQSLLKKLHGLAEILKAAQGEGIVHYFIELKHVHSTANGSLVLGGWDNAVQFGKDGWSPEEDALYKAAAADDIRDFAWLAFKARFPESEANTPEQALTHYESYGIRWDRRDRHLCGLLRGMWNEDRDHQPTMPEVADCLRRWSTAFVCPAAWPPFPIPPVARAEASASELAQRVRESSGRSEGKGPTPPDSPDWY